MYKEMKRLIGFTISFILLAVFLIIMGNSINKNKPKGTVQEVAAKSIEENRIDSVGIVLEKVTKSSFFSMSYSVIIELDDLTRKEIPVSRDKYINIDVGDTLTRYEDYRYFILASQSDLFIKVERPIIQED